MAEIINILPLNPSNFEFQEYSSNDLNLIVSTEVETSFDPTTDYIEYYVYVLGGNIIVSNKGAIISPAITFVAKP